MFSESAKYYLLKSVNEEIANANKWGETYTSMHEAYAVLKEEIEEADEVFNSAKLSLEAYWDLVRGNADESCMEQCIVGLKDAAYSATKELIQVTAVCYKIQFTLKEEA